MDSSQWQQGIGVVRAAADHSPSLRPAEKKPRPDQSANCPRCNSTNTKFCYYNNYSLSQPRFFCKTCRRYWTEGGTLRNVPVGGGSRRKHRPSPSISSKKSPPHQNPKLSSSSSSYNNPPTPTPTPIYNGTGLLSLPSTLDSQNPNFSTTDSSHLSFMDLLKTTGTFAANSVFGSSSVFSSGFPVHEIKPSLAFSLDRVRVENATYGSLQPTVQDHTISSTTGFAFEEPKPGFDLHRGLPLDSNGYWNGVLPGGSW